MHASFHLIHKVLRNNMFGNRTGNATHIFYSVINNSFKKTCFLLEKVIPR